MLNLKLSNFALTVLITTIMLAFLSGCQHLHNGAALSQNTNTYKANKSKKALSPKEIFDYVQTNGKLPPVQPNSNEYAAINKEWNKFTSKYSKKNNIDGMNKDMPTTLQMLISLDNKIKSQKTDNKSKGKAKAATLKIPASGVIEIPRHSLVAWTTQGNCLDPDRAAPRKGNRFKIVPIAGVITEELLPVYS
ncbi:MAG: hypothetical protein ACRCTY_05410, partial [Candidatus Adiutrix sp.]